jgi:phosphomannomutase
MSPSSSRPPQVRFGTAGIRGRSEEFITAELASRVACALARDFAAAGRKGSVVVARDTREHAEEYARAAALHFAAHGLAVDDLGVACSGLVCNYVISAGASGGLYVTGSHLPEGQIGLIALDAEAAYVGAEDARRVEAMIGQPCPASPVFPPGEEPISARDPRPAYWALVRKLFPSDLKGIKVAIDPAGGSSAHFAASVLAGLGADVVTINDTPTPHFPREPEPRARTLEKLRETLLASGAHLAAGYDIDADRVYFFDEKGEGVPEDVTGAILAQRSLSKGDACVAPVNSSTLIEEVCERAGARFTYCRIGQPEIVRAMKREKAKYAYEESGKYYVKGLLYSDSIAATAAMARIVKDEGPLSRIVAALPRLHKWSAAVECPEAKKGEAMRLAVAEAPHSFPAKPHRYVDIDGLKVIFRDGSWVMIRASGTEELLRVYAEAREEPRARAFGERGKELLGRCVAQAAAG